MKKYILVGLASLVFSGCTFFETPEQKVLASCAVITSATETLTLHIDKLEDSQIEYISESLNFAEPICTADHPNFDKVKQQTLAEIGKRLSSMAEKF